MSSIAKYMEVERHSQPTSPTCAQCNACNLCVSFSEGNRINACLDESIKQQKIIGRGEYVFKEHRPFKSLFSVRSGAIKTYAETSNGEIQITGIYMPGEIIGLDSTNTDAYNCSAKALELSSVCEIPFNHLETLAAKNPALQHHFFALMSEEIQRSQSLTLLLSKKSAEGRMACLLIDLSKRFQHRRLSGTNFRLPMTRIDISNYLGLAVETVSRVLTLFQKNNIISLKGRELILLEIPTLVEMSNHNH